MRVRTIAMLLGLAMVGLVLAPPAHAGGDHDDDGPSTTTTTPPGGVGIGDGLFFTGAVITAPGDAAPRTLDAYQAAVFVQSWLGAAFFGDDDIQRDPPPDLPVYRIDVTGDWAGDTGTVTVYYASDGTTPFVAFPGLLVSPATPPPPSNWFAPPPRVIDAFNGTAELGDTLGTREATSTRTSVSAEEAASSGASSGSASGWGRVALAAAVVLVGGGGGLWLRRRRA